jgi:hypothetical protein
VRWPKVAGSCNLLGFSCTNASPFFNLLLALSHIDTDLNSGGMNLSTSSIKYGQFQRYSQLFISSTGSSLNTTTIFNPAITLPLIHSLPACRRRLGALALFSLCSRLYCLLPISLVLSSFLINKIDEQGDCFHRNTTSILR